MSSRSKLRDSPAGDTSTRTPGAGGPMQPKKGAKRLTAGPIDEQLKHGGASDSDDSTV